MAGFRSPFAAVFDLLFGYDVFISYTQRDAGEYAPKLCDALKKHDYQCFLDNSELPSGEKLRDGLLRALRRSHTLVVVASRDAFESPWVSHELDTFRRVKPRGRVVPIGIGRSIDDAPDSKELTTLIKQMDLVWSREDPNNLATGPSEGILKSLLTGFGFTRRNTWRRRIVIIVSAVLMLFAVAALVSFWRAKSAQTESRRKARVAQIRRLAAESLAFRDRFPQRSLLLAVEAVRAAQLDEEVHEEAHASAEQALRELVSYTGGRELGRVTRPITIVAYGPGNPEQPRWLAAGSEDDTVLLWDRQGAEFSSKPRVLTGHTAPVRSLAFSPDQRWVVTGSEDGMIRRWALGSNDPKTSQPVSSVHQGAVAAIAISRDGSTLATIEANGTQIHLWDLSAEAPFNKERASLSHPQCAQSLLFGSKPTTLVAANNDGTLQVWDLANPGAAPTDLRRGGRPGPREGSSLEITSMAIGGDDRWLLAGGKDKLVQLWDLRETPPVGMILGAHAEWVHAVAISGLWAVSGGGDGRVFRWDLRSPKPSESPLLLFGNDRRAVAALAINRYSNLLVTAGDDETAQIWNLVHPDPRDSSALRGHEDGLSALAISPDSHSFVTGSKDGSVREWELRIDGSTILDSMRSPQVLRGHDGEVSAVAISADGRFLATGCEDGQTRLWSISPTDLFKRPKQEVPGNDRVPRQSITALSISPDGHWLSSGGLRAPTRLWDLTHSPPELQESLGSDHAALAISADSRWLVVGDNGVTVTLRDLKSETPTAVARKLSGNGYFNVAFAFSLDNRWLAAGSKDKTALLWDLSASSERPMHVLRGHGATVKVVTISPDSHWLATASSEKIVRLWDLTAADPSSTSKELTGHDGNVTSLAFSPDSRWLVTGSEDETARLWDLSSRGGKPKVHVLGGHVAPVSSVAIAGDRPWVITASYDHFVRLWDLKASDPTANPVLLTGHTAGINAIATSKDGRFLLTGAGLDYQARLWLLRSDDLVELASKTAGRILTKEERQLLRLQ